MKKFTSLLIGLSLTVVGAAFAQNPEESPAGGGKKQGKQKTEQTETKAPKTQGATGEQGAGAERGHKGKGANATGATTTEQGATGTEQGTGKGHKGKAANATGNETNVSGQTTGGATTETGAGKGHKSHGAKAETSTTAGATGTNAEAGASATIAPLPKDAVRGERGMKGNRANANAAPSASAAPSVAATGATGATATTGQTNTTTNVGATGAATTHVEKEKVQVVKQQAAHTRQQYATFKAQPRPDRAPAVTFNQSYRIEGSDRWSGPQYEVFRSYHPERHDRGWYHSHYQRVELIAGGYYYWNQGYWYPAWGYEPSAEYYAYDAPIYVGHSAEPPDRVIADVQAELQQMGYYQGEVDGLLGPMTRQALTAYQADQGLQVTAVIDEPTLDSLNLG